MFQQHRGEQLTFSREVVVDPPRAMPASAAIRRIDVP